jgi:hypothetical protein
MEIKNKTLKKETKNSEDKITIDLHNLNDIKYNLSINTRIRAN